MLKYQKKRLFKTLSRLLAIVMLLTSPIRITQTYAVESELPTATDIQGELPLGTSEITEPSGVSDNSAPPEAGAQLMDDSPLEIELFETDTILPEFAPGYPKQYLTADPGSRYIWMSVIPLTGTVTTHYVAVEYNANAPTKEQVRDEKDSNNSVPLISGHREITMAPSGVAIAVGPLPQSDTTYDIWVVLEDTNGNLSEPKKLEIRTPNNLQMVDGYPKIGATQAAGSKKVEILTQANGGATAYYVVIADEATAPNKNQIYAGKNGDLQPALVAGSMELTENTETALMVDLPTDATDYDVYMVLYEYNGVGSGITIWSEVVKLDVKTPADFIASDVLEASTTGELNNALWRAKDGDTIQLTQDIVYNDNTTAAYAVITIKGKNITLDMNGHNLTIGNTGLGMGLRLEKAATNQQNATQLHVIGSGNLKISSTGHALSVGASKFTSASTVNVEFWSLSGSGIGGSLAEVDIQKGSVTGRDGIYAGHNSIITVKGPVKATVDSGIKLKPSKLYPEDLGCIVNVTSIEAIKCGISMDGGNVTVDGTITAPAYIQFNDEDSTAINGYLATTTKDGYRTYQHATAGTVWVKESSNVCAVDAVQYVTLGEALKEVPNGGTIKLLKNITYTDFIEISAKTINFDLGNYDLLLDTSASLSYTPSLRIIDGGKLNLTGSGTGEFNIKGASTAIAINGINSEATVHNVEVTGDNNGVYMGGTGDNLESNSTVTVKGNIRAEKGNGVMVNAKYGKVIVDGNITAGKIGMQINSNPGTQVIVNGDITVINDTPDNLYKLIGIQAYSQTTVTVTGNVTVRGTNCLGVHASGSMIKIDGNVMSSDKGAHSDRNGEIEITGSLTAGTPFIMVGTTTMTAEQGTKTTPNFIVYTDGTNIIGIGSIGDPVPLFYTSTVQNDGNGTTSASPSSATIGSEVTLTTTSNGGFRFKEWQVLSGGVNIVNNKFIMPASNVVIRAIFEAIPLTNHTVTFDLGGGTRTGGGQLTQTVPNSGSAIAPTVTRSGYIFTGWDKAFTNVTHSLTITARWNYKSEDKGGTGGSSGSSSGGSTNIIITPPAQDKPNAPTQAEINVDGKLDTNGNLTVIITNKNITDSINKATKKAKENGNEANGITLVLNVSTGEKKVNTITVNLPKTVQDTIISNNIINTFVVVDNLHIKIDMDLSTIKEINKQANADVNITANPIGSSNLTGNAKTAIGSRPAFDFKVNYGNSKQVQSFGAGNVSISISYTLGANEEADNVQAVYVDSNGKLRWLISSVYDSANKVLRFNTNHFSIYGVGYKQGVPDFTDISSHWTKNDIEFVVSRGLFAGTDHTTFSPNMAMTRGMFVTALGRLANADVNAYKQSSFIDVKKGAYYMSYIEWANKNNMVTGIGGGKFTPDQSITREQMAVIMSNYAKTIGFTLPEIHVENTFADNAKISPYAMAAVKQMQMAGVISGKNGNILDPQGTATRADVSAVLHRFIELGMSSDIKQSWAMSQSGKWMYYENGKPITSQKTIDGATYTFNANGETTDIPKNLSYTTYTLQKGDSFWLMSHKLGCTISELERLNNKSRFHLIHPNDVLRVPEK